MAARFGPLPRSLLLIKRHGCARLYASEELILQAAWLCTLVRFRGAQLSAEWLRAAALNCQAACVRASLRIRGALLSSGTAASF
eukprot:3927246-Heterocapsa_arctica.AAC.3